MKILNIDGLWNVRDVGGIRTSTGVIREGRLLRSANLAKVTASGAKDLASRIDHIIDLRADDEVYADPSVVDGPMTTHLPLFHGSVVSFFEEDASLETLYRHLLHESGDRLVSALRIIAKGERTLVHCTVGKDRTGVTVALALDAVGADRDAIVADYALTASQLPAERNRRIAEFLRAQHPEALNAIQLATESPAPVMEAILQMIDAEWGSSTEYLRAHGFSDADRESLVRALVEQVEP